MPNCEACGSGHDHRMNGCKPPDEITVDRWLRMRDERDAALLQLDQAITALNKIHDLAGEMGTVHPHVGAIQAWVHEVSPCKIEKRNQEKEES